MNKAVFLDRDGVLNSDEGHYYVFRSEDLKINPGVLEGLKSLARAGFILVIISNQGGISKREYTKVDTDKFHKAMLAEFAKQGIEVAEIYYCPHHSSIENCFCRKPDSLMIEKALARFRINPSASFMIGDSQRDVEAGQKAGLTSFLVPKNSSIVEICKNIVAQSE